MRPHIAARLHAFVHGLLRPTDAAESRALYDATAALFAEHGLHTEDGRDEYLRQRFITVAAEFGVGANHPQFTPLVLLIRRLLADHLILPDIDWNEKRGTAQWWELREELNRQKGYVADLPATTTLLETALTELVRPVMEGLPGSTTNPDDLTVATTLLHNLGDFPARADAMLELAFARDLREQNLLMALRLQAERNLIAASGGNPHDPRGFTRTPVWPSKSTVRDPEELAATYFAGTPLFDFLQQDIAFAIPTVTRFEHCHIVAGSGHGKTQTLQYLICRDLAAVAQGRRSIVVIDSQGDLIRNIASLKEFAPGGSLYDRVVIIDPADVEYPVSLNLFDVGVERLASYAPVERERPQNSILELYDYVLGTLLSAELTQKQNVIFRYVTRLMLHIPDATIHTLRELMEKGSETRFAKEIATLPPTARRFFETEFAGKEFAATRQQVLRRLWGILENQTFERMFSHPRSKLDLFGELNASKVILINTAKDLLKEQGAEIFGRFFIALIAQAAQERATLPEEKRVPTFVYVDEAADYFDRNIGVILAQARKYNVGMVLAHQYLGQLPPALLDAFAANTTIKLAGGVSNKDARALAPMLHCEPELIERQRKGSFAAFVRGQTEGAVPLAFPLGFLEAKTTMTKEERAALQTKMRETYAVPAAEFTPTTETKEPEPEAKKAEPKPKPPPNKDDIDTEPTDSW